MEAKGFFSSLFDYSFGSYITPKIIKVLYVLATVLIALWTLAFVLIAFNASSGFGVLTLLILGPLYFVIAMIYARVLLELLSAFFHIHDDVKEIKLRGGGPGGVAIVPSTPPPVLDPTPGGVAAVTALGAAPAPEPPAPLPAEETIAETPPTAAEPVEPTATPESIDSAEPEVEQVRYCENCGATRRPGGNFCTSCGYA